MKPGFTPAEDVTRFRSSRQLEADARASRGPPGSATSRPPSILSQSPALQAKAGMSKSQKQNLKKREKKADELNGNGDVAANGNRNGTSEIVKGKKKQAGEEEEAPEDWDDDGDDKKETVSTKNGEEKSPVIEDQEPKSSEMDQQKRARALAKKLKAAELLKEKDESTLLPEQKAKVDSIEELRKELEGLGV